ncbi:hypothetical protein BVRB_7g172560 [Beta vulgaris subsp. vulgaris]|nr:hypothetical protein BVRB_7g172560 [Beta vulgaris subsp. vulgaris]
MFRNITNDRSRIMYHPLMIDSGHFDLVVTCHSLVYAKGRKKLLNNTRMN